VISRLALAAGFAAAVAGSTLLAPTAHASCSAGEEEDVYTTVCTPFMAPNTGSPFSAIPGNPDIPAIDGVPCTGRDAGQCIGLAEDAEAAGPEVVPRTTISASP
jgi:hypothetical protein